MQTPLNSLETRAVISETLERDPSFSFLHQLQNHHVRQSSFKQLITKQGKGGKKKKRIIKQLVCPKKISLFFQVYFQMGRLFFPSHAHPESALRGSEGWSRQGLPIESIIHTDLL